MERAPVRRRAKHATREAINPLLSQRDNRAILNSCVDQYYQSIGTRVLQSHSRTIGTGRGCTGHTRTGISLPTRPENCCRAARHVTRHNVLCACATKCNLHTLEPRCKCSRAYTRGQSPISAYAVSRRHRAGIQCSDRRYNVPIRGEERFANRRDIGRALCEQACGVSHTQVSNSSQREKKNRLFRVSKPILSRSVIYFIYIAK